MFFSLCPIQDKYEEQRMRYDPEIELYPPPRRGFPLPTAQ